MKKFNRCLIVAMVFIMPLDIFAQGNEKPEAAPKDASNEVLFGTLCLTIIAPVHFIITSGRLRIEKTVNIPGSAYFLHLAPGDYGFNFEFLVSKIKDENFNVKLNISSNTVSHVVLFGLELNAYESYYDKFENGEAYSKLVMDEFWSNNGNVIRMTDSPYVIRKAIEKRYLPVESQPAAIETPQTSEFDYKAALKDLIEDKKVGLAIIVTHDKEIRATIETKPRTPEFVFTPNSVAILQLLPGSYRLNYSVTELSLLAVNFEVKLGMTTRILIGNDYVAGVHSPRTSNQDELRLFAINDGKAFPVNQLSEPIKWNDVISEDVKKLNNPKKWHLDASFSGQTTVRTKASHADFSLNLGLLLLGDGRSSFNVHGGFGTSEQGNTTINIGGEYWFSLVSDPGILYLSFGPYWRVLAMSEESPIEDALGGAVGVVWNFLDNLGGAFQVGVESERISVRQVHSGGDKDTIIMPPIIVSRRQEPGDVVIYKNKRITPVVSFMFTLISYPF